MHIVAQVNDRGLGVKVETNCLRDSNLGWISRKVLKHGIILVLRYLLCSYLSLFYL